MLQKKKENPLNIIEYFEWVESQKFGNSEKHHERVSLQEQDFVQYVIYPMFYHYDTKFKTSIPFPLVLKDYSSWKPKYVIDNQYFTIVFFLNHTYDYQMYWEVSVHIKDHDFCDKRIKEFKEWYLQHYLVLFVQMDGMPKEFLYPSLNYFDDEVQDFCTEFWRAGRDCMLFKLMDLLRLF